MQRFFVRVFAANGPAGKTLRVTFDAALSTLAELPRLVVEPDGSFVWKSSPGISPPWQVDGTLVDGGRTLFFCELKGCCPPEPLDQLLACLSDGTARLLFEAVEQGTMMGEEEFRGFISLPDVPAPAPDRLA